MEQQDETEIPLTPDQILELESSCVQRLLTAEFCYYADLLSRDEIIEANAGVAIRQLLKDDEFFTHKLAETGYLRLSNPVIREKLKHISSDELKSIGVTKLYTLEQEAEKYALQKLIDEGHLLENETLSLSHELRGALINHKIQRILQLQKKSPRDLFTLTSNQLYLLQKASVRDYIRKGKLSWEKLSSLSEYEYQIIKLKGIDFFEESYSKKPEVQITHDGVRAKKREMNEVFYLTDHLPVALKPFLNTLKFNALSADKKREMGISFGHLLDVPPHIRDLRIVAAKILKEHFNEFYTPDKTALTLMCIWTFRRHDTLFAKAPRDIMRLIATHSQDKNYAVRPRKKTV